MKAAYPRHRPVLAAEARAADVEASERFGLPSILLMEHAGRGLALAVADVLPPGGVVAVLCGPGNNGGDGYACARFLRSFGVEARVVRCAPDPPSSADAALEHAVLSRETEVAVAATEADAPVVQAALDGAAVVVDALFGTGGRLLRLPFVEWIERVNRARAIRVAADLPSGLHPDEGTLLPLAVRADVTAAMGLVKRGCTIGAGPAHCGRIVEIDIGLPRAIHERFL